MRTKCTPGHDTGLCDDSSIRLHRVEEGGAYLFIELKAQIVAGLALIFNIMGDHVVEKTTTPSESLQ